MAAPVDPIPALGAAVQSAAKTALGDVDGDVAPLVRRSDRADYQAGLALGLARRLKKPPRAVAESIAAALAPSDLLERVEVAGPGFLNLTVRASWLSARVQDLLADPRLGVSLSDAPERVIVDYSHPNVAKEMHVGHLRSTIIGDAVARILEWRGHTVIRQNHIGDWGTPFGMLIEHLDDLGRDEAERHLALGDLAEFYKAARKKFDEDPLFAERSRRRVVLLQGGDEGTLARWRVLIDLSTLYFEAVYDKLGVTLRPEHVRGESFYNPMLAPLAKELRASGAATESDGALCVFSAGFKNKEGNPLPLIVQKGDGGFGYAATDLAAIRYRAHDLAATRILYIVGAPQAQHLAMVFAAARDLGWIEGARPEHAAFGSVLGTDKRMFKSREGETVRLVDLIDAAIERAEAVVATKAADLEPDVRAEVARKIGVGSIKYADLSSDRIKDYVFDLDRMVSFDGNTAGYLQYAHARIRSIFRKAALQGEVEPARTVQLGDAPEERTLVLDLLGFGAVVKGVEESLEPHRLAGYLYGLATAFTAFYQKCPILKAEPGTRAARLAIAEATARTLAQGLSLLGIEAPDRM